VKLVTFFALALLVHGPLSPFLPTAFEATLLYYARLYPAWLLALVGTLGASIAESVNYRLVDWAAELPKLARLTDRRWVRWSVAAFRRAPFWTTVIVIFSPIPDTAVRVLAPLARYPLPRFLGAVALGRFPRVLLIAGVGGIVVVPTWALLGSGVVLVGIAVGRQRVASAFRWLRGRYATSTPCPSQDFVSGTGVDHVAPRPRLGRRYDSLVLPRAHTRRVGRSHGDGNG